MFFGLILSILGEYVLPKVGESFLAKVWDLIADNALKNANTIKDFELTLKTLHKNLNSLSYKASDVEEQIKNAELSGHKKRKREVEEWLRQVESIDAEVRELGTQAEGIITRLMDGGNAAKLNQQVEKLVDQSRNFGELAVDVCGTRGVTVLTTGMVGGASEENLGRVLELLEAGNVFSIGVHGVGGAGKTTMAKHINNRLVEQSKWTVVWVTVSREFSVRSLQDKIARSLGVKLLDEDEEEIRAARLHGVLLKKKNVVVILDDVWENIDLLKVGCPFSLKCCRLIITTRSLEVCRRIGCQQVIEVERQNEDDDA